MPEPGRFQRFNRSLSNFFEWVGFGGLLIMVFLTCIDVIGAKVFLKPIFGALDIVMLAQLVAISFGTAMALLLGRHVQVEFFMDLLPNRLQAAIDSVIILLEILLFVLIMWRLGVYGYSLQTGGETAATIRVPLFPFAYSVSVACIPVCLVLIADLFKSLHRMVKK